MCTHLVTLVAEPGIEPGAWGYEPQMLPLHYPAKARGTSRFHLILTGSPCTRHASDTSGDFLSFLQEVQSTWRPVVHTPGAIREKGLEPNAVT